MSYPSGLYPLSPAKPPIKKVGSTPSSVFSMGTFRPGLSSLAIFNKEICWNEGIKTFLLEKDNSFQKLEKKRRLLDSLMLTVNLCDYCCFIIYTNY